MKFTIFYFSGTGNTWWVCREFAKIVNKSEHDAEFISIEQDDIQSMGYLQKKLQFTDALGIAYPIYGSTAPQIVWNFMESLEEASQKISIDFKENKKKRFGFILTTMALFSGDGALVLNDEMKKIAFPLLGAINIKMSSNISIPGFHYDPVEKEKLEKRKQKAQKKLKNFFKKLRNDKKKLEGRWNLLGKLGGWIQRKFMDWALNRTIDWNANMERCTKCMLCVKECPTDNITFENEAIRFLDKCTYCMRCYNFCPTHAISPREEIADPKKYKRHRGCTENFKLSILHD
ncbi:MAG: putative 4Fe-4S ferredoxin, iron-sulfur binding [Promethearchaeota archaeon]|nr:MAG: putative 4Fe-4S ferredoxin, iron-sulfur binding [Candidatus Lokiarchaeota archaeon]